MKITRTRSEEVVVVSTTVTHKGIVIVGSGEAISPKEARQFAKELKKIANQVELNTADIVDAQVVDFDDSF